MGNRRQLASLLFSLALLTACSSADKHPIAGGDCCPLLDLTEEVADGGLLDDTPGGESDQTLPGDLPGPAETLGEVALPEVITACPADPPPPGPASCSGSLHCEYGQECCCGQCDASLVCDCLGGTWGCAPTDSCLAPWCHDYPCCEPGMQEDCAGGVGEICTAHPEASVGKCLPPPAADECWVDSDCSAGLECAGAEICPCEAECVDSDKPGTCVATQFPEACKADSHCPGGFQCVAHAFCEGFPGDCPKPFGTCLPTPAPGLCWGAGDCSDGQLCVNPVFCPGGDVCLVEPHPGVCLDFPLTGCWADADCPDAGVGSLFRCTGQWVIPWWTGNDYDSDPDHTGECCQLKPGECLEDGDCLAGQHCVGATYPYLGACGDKDGSLKAGQCTDLNPWPDELCLSNAECLPGESCIGEWSCPEGLWCLDQDYPGLCLVDPIGALEYCYEIANCPSGKECLGEWVCDVIDGDPCGGVMASPGVCEPFSYPPAGLGEPCGPDGGSCLPGLACCYPCGIPGCTFTCTTPCDPEEPWCSDGCAAMP